MIQAIFESLFDISYIVFAIVMGLKIILGTEKGTIARLFGIMTLVLVFGDMFHLLPRIASFVLAPSDRLYFALGYGKMMTSITMTLFYFILYMVWRKRYYIVGKEGITVTIIFLSVIRIILCLSPANQWALETSSYAWGIYRNIPFILIGLTMIGLFYNTRNKMEDDPLSKMWLAIILSFAFYAPVIFLVDFIPMVGMLMIPKTMSYIWVIVMGYKLDGKEEDHIKGLFLYNAEN